MELHDPHFIECVRRVLCSGESCESELITCAIAASKKFNLVDELCLFMATRALVKF